MPKKLLAAAGVLAVSAVLMPAPAQAQTAAVTPMRADAAGAFAARLGDTRTGGTYVDAAGRAVVTVTDTAAARSVRAAGGVAQVVSHSLAELRTATGALDDAARIPGTSWGIDPGTNQVAVELDSTVTGAQLDKLRAVTDRLGDRVRVTRIAGELRPTAGTFTSGGQGIQDKAENTRCSIGFNVRNAAGARFFVTAGHCGNEVTSWDKAADGTYLGTVKESSFPGNDYAIVTYKNPDVTPYGTVWVNGAEEQITSSRYPVAGEPVSRAGTTSTDLVGKVLTLNNTVNYQEGTVTGLVKTTLCAENGDSGGALFSGTVALGITSGSTNPGQACSDNVASDQRTYYQPVQEVLDHAGLTVY
jgi:streptogrisin D